MEKLDSRLWMPPKSAVKDKVLPKESPWSDEATKASLLAFVGAAGGGAV